MKGEEGEGEAPHAWWPMKGEEGEGEVPHAWWSMEGKREVSNAWWLMEGEGEGLFHLFSFSPQQILLKPSFFPLILNFYFTMVLSCYLHISSLFLDL